MKMKIFLSILLLCTSQFAKAEIADCTGENNFLHLWGEDIATSISQNIEKPYPKFVRDFLDLGKIKDFKKRNARMTELSKNYYCQLVQAQGAMYVIFAEKTANVELTARGELPNTVVLFFNGGSQEFASERRDICLVGSYKVNNQKLENKNKAGDIWVGSWKMRKVGGGIGPLIVDDTCM
jgi:hypothetical protein